ncbi:cytochrome P450 [Coprinopsis sp. MPI-PUGE-AT-0042]|nr:cytochrome P450 [Coprinopsis sp. MPI-PUGE-AT-0042]
MALDFQLSDLTTNYIAAAACASIVFYALLTKFNSKRYPPGPKGLPLIGSLFEMPIQNAHVVYKDWASRYGDMLFFKVLGQPFLILSSDETITELMDKRSTIYSSRPRATMVVELMGWTYAFGLLPYGERWRFLRREFHRFMSPTAVLGYRQIQQNSVYSFLNNLLETPDSFSTHLRLFYGSISMKISYGYDVKDAHDPYLVAAEGAMGGFLEAGIPGRFWVDLFPLLKYVPAWMPGAEFKRKAARWRYLNDISLERPFKHVMDKLRQGTASQSVSATMIEELPDKNHPERQEKEIVARNISATTFLAGIDTIHSLTLSFFYGMIQYPEVQKKAQAEIDRVVGDKRLPTFEDRNELPYINALIKELIRWSDVAPLGIFHSTTVDDEYKGYFIPKGTIVMTNTWSMLTDPVKYPDPFSFKPERYLKNGVLNPNAPKPEDLAFGNGRRICPGRYLADDTLYMIIVGVLAAFDISAPIDSTTGKPMQIKNERVGTITLQPPKFDCQIKPRSAGASSMIRDAQEAISAL